MAQPNTGTNRYNPNSGSQNDLIDQMIAAGFSDEEIQARLKQLQNTAPDTSTTDTGSADIASFLAQQQAAQEDQAQTEGLLGLLKYMEPDQAPAVPQLSLPQGAQTNLGSNYQTSGDGAADRYAAQQRRFEMMQALNMDQILRGRNREDALWMLQNQPAAEAAPVNPQRQQLIDMIMGKLLPKAQEAAPTPEMSYAGGTVTGRSPQDSVMMSQLNEMGRQGVDTVNNIFDLLRQRAGQPPKQQNQGGGGFLGGVKDLFSARPFS